MFKLLYSGKISPLTYNPRGIKPIIKNGLYNYEYTINDDDFSEVWFGKTDQTLNNPIVRCGALIECYESKGMDVAYNIALYHNWIYNSWVYALPIEEEIKNNRYHTPGYKYFESDIRKCLDKIDKLKVFK